MPYLPPPPKSACNLVLPSAAMMLLISRAESLRTGNFETSLFHALSAGNTWHPPTTGGFDAAAPAPESGENAIEQARAAAAHAPTPSLFTGIRSSSTGVRTDLDRRGGTRRRPAVGCASMLG